MKHFTLVRVVQGWGQHDGMPRAQCSTSIEHFVKVFLFGCLHSLEPVTEPIFQYTCLTWCCLPKAAREWSCSIIIIPKVPVHLFTHSGVARMSKFLGHSMGTLMQCVCNMHLLGGPVTCSRYEKFIHSEIASEAVFGHKYHSFSLTCMLTSCPHETCDHTC